MKNAGVPDVFHTFSMWYLLFCKRDNIFRFSNSLQVEYQVEGIKRMKKKSKSIRKQIMLGYSRIMLVMLLLVALSLVSLVRIEQSYRVVSRNRNNQAHTQSALAKHYEWLELFNDSIQDGVEFKGSLNHNTCQLGLWLADLNEEDLSDPVVVSTLQMIKPPHEQMHTLATEVLSVSKRDREEARGRYMNEIKPLVNQVIEGLGRISGQYEKVADETSEKLESTIFSLIVISILGALVGFLVAAFYGNRSSKQISGPIVAVADWSNRLSQGADEIKFDEKMLAGNQDNEIGAMILSFQRMVDSIHENVSVVQRLAQGDMTVFVNIRSEDDVLGSSLYHLVQSNDFMFAKIIKVAMSVASSSHDIANASQMLADTSVKQAAAVQELNDSTEETKALVEKNAEQMVHATGLSQSIRQDVQYSNEKMEMLVRSVKEINESSRKIANVIKLIDDIAFQTNILALNAAVEAARAGEAGKGFAVVADEVRTLALRSSEAADESKNLIEATMRATTEGSRISSEAFDTFQHIVEDLDRITEVVSNISDSSERQENAITRMHTQVELIRDSITANASVSEEAAAASNEMRENAKLLEEEMRQFNLRQRRMGHAYIPPEKRDDEEFIREANENYQKALRENSEVALREAAMHG